MPVPSAISDLSTTPGLNSPSGSESPASIDDYLRTHAAFIRQVSDSNDSSNVKLTGNQTIAGIKTFSSPIAGSITGNAATATSQSGGTVNATSFNGGQLAGMRNKIINGDFRINQRAYASGAATTAGQYTLDRWKVTGTGGITFSTANNKTTITIPGGQTLQQVIEGLNLESGTYVLSWEGTAQGRINGGAYAASGAVTATLTGGTNATIEFNTGTVTSVQLEQGTLATPFERRHIGQELALCQRYLPAFKSSGINSPIPASVLISSATIALMTVFFSVKTRVPPTGVVVSSASHFTVSDIASAPASSSVVFDAATEDAARLTVTGSGWTLGRSGLFYFNSAIGQLLFTGCEL